MIQQTAPRTESFWAVSQAYASHNNTNNNNNNNDKDDDNDIDNLQ